MVNYRFQKKNDPKDVDNDAKGIIKLVDTREIYVPNNLKNAHWNETEFGTGYLQWLQLGNTPLPSETGQEKVDRYKTQVLEFVSARGEDLRRLIVTLEDRLALDDKNAEAVLWWNNGAPPPPGFDPINDAPYAWEHTLYRESLYIELNLIPPLKAQIATDILTDWHAAFVYFAIAGRKIDAVIEQSSWGVNLATTLNQLEIIENTSISEFDVIEVYILDYVPG